MSKLAWLMVAVALAGCVTEGATPVITPQAPGTPQLADARTRADIHTQLGSAYFEVRNFAVALESLNEALKADPNYGPAHNMLGLVYMELRDDARAQQSFERALRINPLDSDANNNYGWYLCQRKRYEEGIQHFMTALKNPLYQTPDKSYVNAGLCAQERGDDVGATQYFERALQFQPVQPQALYQLAELAYRKGDMPAAKNYMTRLAKTGVVFSPEALWLALRVERRLGDRDAEASYGQQLRKNFPNSRETQALLNRKYE